MANHTPEGKEMGKLLRVVMIHENGNLIVEGEQAEKWSNHCKSLSVLASIRAGNQNPFDNDPVEFLWEPK